MQVRILNKHGDKVATFDIANAGDSPLDYLVNLKRKLQAMYPPKQFKIHVTL